MNFNDLFEPTPEKPINKISDIEIGKVYYISFGRDGRTPKRSIVTQIINRLPNSTEVEFIRNKSIHLCYLCEIGIAEFKLTSARHYGRLKYEANESFATSYVPTKPEDLDDRLKRFYLYSELIPEHGSRW